MIKKIILASVIYCLSTIFLQNALAYYPAPGFVGLPPGSYIQTCRNCSMDANGTLICSCADRSGMPRNTALPAARYCSAVDNINGQLRCSQWSRPYRPLPPKRPRHVVDIEAGPIWNQMNAQQVCPGVCQNNNGKWTGQWNTTVWGQMSVCQCRLY